MSLLGSNQLSTVYFLHHGFGCDFVLLCLVKYCLWFSLVYHINNYCCWLLFGLIHCYFTCVLWELASGEKGIWGNNPSDMSSVHRSHIDLGTRKLGSFFLLDICHKSPPTKKNQFISTVTSLADYLWLLLVLLLTILIIVDNLYCYYYIFYINILMLFNNTI